jgi:hypothetical protein
MRAAGGKPAAIGDQGRNQQLIGPDQPKGQMGGDGLDVFRLLFSVFCGEPEFHGALNLISAERMLLIMY